MTSAVETTERRAAFEAAMDAITALLEARDAAVAALEAFGDTFAVGASGGWRGELDKPVSEALLHYAPETLALWAELAAEIRYLDDGDGSCFEFGYLTEHLLPGLNGRLTAWERGNHVA